jgi:hypothetical protein
MASEETPQPLDGEEIKNAIVYRIGQAIHESLDKHCRLYQRAYPKFRAFWTVHYELDDFGREIVGDVKGDLLVQEHSEALSQYAVAASTFDGEPIPEDLSGEIPETPPNQLRRETEQAVPTMVQTAQGTEQKAVFYKPNNRGPRIGRSLRDGRE